MKASNGDEPYRWLDPADLVGRRGGGLDSVRSSRSSAASWRAMRDSASEFTQILRRWSDVGAYPETS